MPQKRDCLIQDSTGLRVRNSSPSTAQISSGLVQNIVKICVEMCWLFCIVFTVLHKQLIYPNQCTNPLLTSVHQCLKAAFQQKLEKVE